MHLYGEGVTQDYKQALHWYRKTAKQGDSDD
jgi:TPR repeat protein